MSVSCWPSWLFLRSLSSNNVQSRFLESAFASVRASFATILSMIANVALFFVFGVIAYALISLFGQMTGGEGKTFLGVLLAAVKPLPLLMLIVGNIFFAMAIFTALKITPFAIPATIALGAIVAFFYSALFLGGTVTLLKVFGVVLILAGIFFLR